jgi:hypothetical protein
VISARRFFGTLAGVSVVLAVLAPRVAHAGDEESAPLGHRERLFASPQNFAFEFRMGPYRPNVDSDPTLSGTPYASTFGDAGGILVGLELDYQVLRIPHVGTLGPSIGAGLWNKSAKATITLTGEPSAEDTTLSVYPFNVAAVFRADVVSRELRVPLVPYVKVGLDYAIWQTSNTLNISRVDGEVGAGHTNGYHWAAGISFLMDVLDPGSAQALDNEVGINNTYLFFEYTSTTLQGIAQSHVLYLGDSTWNLGLAFEF